MKTHRFPLLAAALIACTALAFGRAPFLAPPAIDVAKELSGPSAPDSIETRRELAMVLALQSVRTPEDVKRMRREGRLAPFLFDDVLGPWFTPQNLPLTAELLERAGKDAMELGEQGKRLWSRPRPPVQDARVTPSVGLPGNGSYPSSHGTCGLLWGTLLAELAPDLRLVLLKRGELIGDDRVLGGVHYPSDVEAGRVLARVLLEHLRANPEFRASLEQARVEFSRVRAAHQQATP